MNDLEKRFMEDSKETADRIGIPKMPIKKGLETKKEEAVDKEKTEAKKI
jgi:hypothetical protein